MPKHYPDKLPSYSTGVV